MSENLQNDTRIRELPFQDLFDVNANEPVEEFLSMFNQPFPIVYTEMEVNPITAEPAKSSIFSTPNIINDDFRRIRLNERISKLLKIVQEVRDFRKGLAE